LTRTASIHGVQGFALYKQRHDQFGALQLVIAGNFASKEARAKEQVRQILRQCEVQLYASSEVDDLIADIRSHGKELMSDDLVGR
jgi:hypothetical protein